MDWKTLLAYISGSVDEELLLRNEYLVAENRILRHQVVSCDDSYPPRIGLRSQSRVDQMRRVNPEAIAGVRW